jgi:hypothetical protein
MSTGASIVAADVAVAVAVAFAFAVAAGGKRRRPCTNKYLKNKCNAPNDEEDAALE